MYNFELIINDEETLHYGCQCWKSPMYEKVVDATQFHFLPFFFGVNKAFT